MQEVSEERLKALLEDAAEAGAKKALASVGLHDETAHNDIYELRRLLDSWREAKRTALRRVVDIFVTGFITVLAASAVLKWWGKS